LHKRDLPLLKSIQAYFGGKGTIHVRSNRNESVILKIRDFKALTEEVIPHFNKYPLVTQKRADFLLFEKVVALIAEKKHLTYEGMREIVGLKHATGKVLPAELVASFPDLELESRPLIELNETSSFEPN